MVLAFLEHPSSKVVMEYFSAKKEQLQRQLEYNWIATTGKDTSDLIRGRIQIIDEFLNLKGVFDRFEKLQKEVEEAGKVNK